MSGFFQVTKVPWSRRVKKASLTYSNLNIPEIIEKSSFRFYLYLFPPEPVFKVDEVGEPAYLTQYIKEAKIDEGRERAKVKGK